MVRASKKIGPHWGITFHVQVWNDSKLTHVGNFKTLALAIKRRDDFLKGKYEPKGKRPDNNIYKLPRGYEVRVTRNGKSVYVGTYQTKREAIFMRDKHLKRKT